MGRTKDYVSVECCICHEKFEKPRYRIRSERFYCSNCHKKTEVICCICKKKVMRWKSSLRWYATRKSPAKSYCSINCKKIGQRKEWNNLSRKSLKIRYENEFGKKALICKRCGHNKAYNIDLHHIIYVSNGGNNQPINLEPLCKNCHGIEHYKKKIDKKE